MIDFIKDFISFKFLGSLIICLLILFNVNPLLTSLFSIVYLLVFLFHNFLRKKENSTFTIIELLIYTLPFSFTPLIPQLKFFSLFVLIQIIFVINYIFKFKRGGTLSRITFLTLISVNIIYLFALGSSPFFYYEVIIKINIFLISVFIVSKSFEINLSDAELLLKKFVITSVAGALTVIIQYVYNNYFGITNLGTQSRMGELRQGFSGVFFDYSIVSIYLAGIAAFLLFNLINSKFIYGFFLDCVLIVFFVTSSALTSARSGLVALTITLLIFLIWKRNFKKLFFGLIIGMPIFIMILQFVSSNRGTEIVSDSGRFRNFENALNYFFENPFFGSSGLGYNLLTRNMLPHNFLLDFLTDYGIIISLLLFAIFIIILKIGINLKSELGFLFLFYMISGLFHASFINTHYIIIPIFIIISLKNQTK